MWWKPLALGALGGVAVGAIVWVIAKRRLQSELTTGARQIRRSFGEGETEIRAQLEAGRRELQNAIRTELDTRLPAMVQRELTTTLTRYNITPETGRRIDRALASAERLGVI